jgi:hypothetical protein
MLLKQALKPSPDQQINTAVRKSMMQFLEHGSHQYNITYGCRLYDEDAFGFGLWLHAAKIGLLATGLTCSI